MKSIITTLAAIATCGAITSPLQAAELPTPFKLTLPLELSPHTAADRTPAAPSVKTPLGSNPFFSQRPRSCKSQKAPTAAKSYFERATMIDQASGQLVPSTETCAIIIAFQEELQAKARDYEEARCIKNFFKLLLSKGFFEDTLGVEQREEYLMSLLVHLQSYYWCHEKECPDIEILLHHFLNPALESFKELKEREFDVLIPLSTTTREFMKVVQNKLFERLKEVTPMRDGDENQFTVEDDDAFRLFFEYIQYTHCYIFTKGCFPDSGFVCRLLQLLERRIEKFHRRAGHTLFNDLDALLKSLLQKLTSSAPYFSYAHEL